MALLKDSVISGNLRITDCVMAKYNNYLIPAGTGVVGSAGSSSAAYVPSKWIFDTTIVPAEGDVITIMVPVAGIASGVWLSIDNGTTYYPVATTTKSRLTTHYPAGQMLQLIFEKNKATSLYGPTETGGAAGSSLADVTSDRWLVLNYYDANTTYSAMSTAEVTAGTASSSRVMQARYLSAGLKAAIVPGATNGHLSVYSQDKTIYTLPTASSGTLGGVKVGTGLSIDANGVLSASALPSVSSSDNGKLLMVVDGAWAAASIPSATGQSF